MTGANAQQFTASRDFDAAVTAAAATLSSTLSNGKDFNSRATGL
jgi:hypothetical protein